MKKWPLAGNQWWCENKLCGTFCDPIAGKIKRCTLLFTPSMIASQLSTYVGALCWSDLVEDKSEWSRHWHCPPDQISEWCNHHAPLESNFTWYHDLIMDYWYQNTCFICSGKQHVTWWMICIHTLPFDFVLDTSSITRCITHPVQLSCQKNIISIHSSHMGQKDHI